MSDINVNKVKYWLFTFDFDHSRTIQTNIDLNAVILLTQIIHNKRGINHLY